MSDTVVVSLGGAEDGLVVVGEADEVDAVALRVVGVDFSKIKRLRGRKGGTLLARGRRGQHCCPHSRLLSTCHHGRYQES